MIKKPSLEEISDFLKTHYQLILGIVFVLLICFNAFIYYQYVYLTMKASPEPTIKKTIIDQEVLQKVLDDLNAREENLSRIETTKYFDPFND